MPKIVSTNAPLSKILNIIEANPEKSIGIITRTNRQIVEISQYLDTNNIKYSSTSSQATTQQAKNEILIFIRGLISDKIEDKLTASFSIFSPYTLREAFQLSEEYHNSRGGRLNELQTWGISMKKIDIDNLFKNVIFPLCVSKGSEWFSTAIVVKQQIDQYLVFEIPSRDELFDFMAITEESQIERDAASKITLTTVHKAKGRDFDIVVYVPTSRIERTSFVDIIVESVLESKGVNIKEELEEESLRVDFVAFTRAREKLIIITDNKNARKYHIQNLCENEIDDKEAEIVATKLNNRLSEAFSLFLAGRFHDSEKLLNAEDGWLEEFILSYFKNVDHFSYSSIKPDPYQFLIENIIAIPSYYAAADFGSQVHKAIADISRNKSSINDFEGDIKRAVENRDRAINELKKEFSGLKLDDVEKRRQLPLSSMIDYDNDDLMFRGFIDAIYKHDNGILIVDYKTDKTTNYSSDHKRQLAVYRKMHSILENIEENKIKIFVVFVSIRGAINTGKFDWVIEKENRNAFPTFENHLRKVLGWKQDPKKFIQDLFDSPRDDLLYQTIKEKLLQSNNQI
jgi:DNA helicase-2/ATP-dependent DNA helicase PcrA